MAALPGKAPLRKAPSKASGGVGGGVGGVKRPLSSLDVGGAPPPKKALSKKPAPSAVKSGAPGKAAITESARDSVVAKLPPKSSGKPSGLSAKMPASQALAPSGPGERPSPKKAFGAIEKKPPPSPNPKMGEGNGVALNAAAAGVQRDETLASKAIRDLLVAIDATAVPNRARDVARLADALGRTLTIEHLNGFLRVMKRKVTERAQRDGVQVPAAAAAAPPPKAPAPTRATPEQAVTPKSSFAKVPPKPAAKATPPTAAPPFQGTATTERRASITKAKAGTISKSKPAAVPEPLEAMSNDASSPLPPGSPRDDIDDPLYVLIGELSEDPVVEDGILKDARLGEVLRRLWDSVVRKPKDWIVAWQALSIPVERQVEALQKFLNMAFVRTEDPECGPMVLAELVKNHRIKMRSAEEVLVAFGHNLDGILAVNEDAWQLYSKFLVHVFPKPAAFGWGWSRVGWSWQSWWQFVEKCVQSLEPARSFEVIALVLQIIQDREGSTLAELPGWVEGDKLQRVLTKLCEFGGCDADEVVEQLSQQGVVVEVA